jgi:hypothetical protein
VARTLAALGGYAYALSDTALWVNLYVQGSVQATVNGAPLLLQVTTDYPWDGKVFLRPVLPNPAQFELRLRIPGWCEGATVTVNKQKQAKTIVERGYLVLGRTWRKGDVVELNLPMPVQRMAANSNVKANHNLLALQRGPLVYCLEACDQSEPLASLHLPAHAELKAEKQKALLGGVMTIRGLAEVAPEQDWTHRLYQPTAQARPVPVVAIPYCAWDNRRAGAMKVWLPVTPPIPPTGGLETTAKVTVSFRNDNSQPHGLNDGLEPKSSGDQPPALCHWWPHRNTEEWAQYTWPKPVSVGGAMVFWFDDTGRGGCRLPASWQIQYLDGAEWKPVSAKGAYPVAKDKWCEVSFDPVKTTALRLAVKLQADSAAGAHEWKLAEADDE